MRLVLDAHLNGRVLGDPLRTAGHDVLSLDSDPALCGLEDAAIMRLAADQKRIVVSCDVGDFSRLAKDYLDAGKHHAGIILMVGTAHHQYGVILRAVSSALATCPSQDDWIDRVVFGVTTRQ